jgi:hypothetical protein
MIIAMMESTVLWMMFARRVSAQEKRSCVPQLMSASILTVTRLIKEIASWDTLLVLVTIVISAQLMTLVSMESVFLWELILSVMIPTFVQTIAVCLPLESASLSTTSNPVPIMIPALSTTTAKMADAILDSPSILAMVAKMTLSVMMPMLALLTLAVNPTRSARILMSLLAYP